MKRDFARWGYPAWFRFLCGALELLSAALLFGQQTRVLGLTLAGAIMVAALFTLLRNREPFGHLAPALIFSALVVVTVALRGWGLLATRRVSPDANKPRGNPCCMNLKNTHMDSGIGATPI